MKVWNLIAAIWLKSQSEVLGYICACKASNTYQTNIFVCCAALSVLFLFIYCCFVLIVTLEQLYVLNYNFDTKSNGAYFGVWIFSTINNQQNLVRKLGGYGNNAIKWME